MLLNGVIVDDVNPGELLMESSTTRGQLGYGYNYCCEPLHFLLHYNFIVIATLYCIDVNLMSFKAEFDRMLELRGSVSRNAELHIRTYKIYVSSNHV